MLLAGRFSRIVSCIDRAARFYRSKRCDSLSPVWFPLCVAYYPLIQPPFATDENVESGTLHEKEIHRERVTGLGP